MTQGGSDPPRWQPGEPPPGWPGREQPSQPPPDQFTPDPAWVERQKPARSASSPEAPPGEPEPPSGVPGPSSSGAEPAGGALATATLAPTPPPPPDPPGGATLPPPASYPMRYDVAYPGRLSRLSTFFRLILLLPALFIWAPLVYLLYASFGLGWLSIFFRRKYPDWLFAAGSGALAWQARAWAYATLQVDHFPSLEAADSPVTLLYDPPPNGQLSRWRVFIWKAVLLIPHVIVLYLLSIAVFVLTVLAWFAILFTGRYPRGMFGFVTGVSRWYFRVVGYFASFNDRFPPFSFSEDAGPASRASTVTCGVTGVLAGAGLVAAVAAAAALANDPFEIEADYDSLQAGIPSDPVIYTGFGDDLGAVRIDIAYDPGDAESPGLEPGRGERIVVFDLRLRNESLGDRTLRSNIGRLSYEDGRDTGSTSAELVIIDGRAAPRKVEEGDTVTVRLIFVIPDDAEPTSLRWRPGFGRPGGARFNFD